MAGGKFRTSQAPGDSRRERSDLAEHALDRFPIAGIGYAFAAAGEAVAPDLGDNDVGGSLAAARNAEWPVQRPAFMAGVKLGKHSSIRSQINSTPSVTGFSTGRPSS